jgi:tetrahydromethanopterin S-methyltransferase subunit F
MKEERCIEKAGLQSTRLFGFAGFFVFAEDFLFR